MKLGMSFVLDRKLRGSGPKYTLREFMATKGYKSGISGSNLARSFDEPLPSNRMVSRSSSRTQSTAVYDLADLNAWWSRIEAKRKLKEAKE